jgi:hypothetical protein
MLGYNSYCDVRLKDQTREEFYKTLLVNQENKLKLDILETLNCSNDEFKYYCDIISKHHTDFEEKIKSNTDHIISIEKISEEHLKLYNKVFPKRNYEDFLIINSNNKHSYTNFMENKFDDKWYLGLSYYSTATIYSERIEYKSKDKNFYEVNRLEILFHELSHLFHRDTLFANVIQIIILDRNCNNTILVQDCIDLKTSTNSIHIKPYENLLSKSKTFVSKKKIKIVTKLYTKWIYFREIRADLEAMFVLKETPEFMNYTNIVLDGYPESYNFLVMYEHYFPVSYRQDFLRGIKNDINIAIN